MIKDNFVLEINTKNIINNYNFFKNLNKNLIVAPTIKANAYGMGSKKIFSLLKKNKCKHFFVATLEEGISLKNKNKKISIYVLNGIQNYNLILFKKNNLIPIINTKTELNKIIRNNIDFGLHVDTGINRLGINYKELPEIIYKNEKINILISHLASADEKSSKFNNIQRKRFLNTITKFKNKKIIFSLSNSNGSVLSRNYLFNMIRPGIALYGGNNKNQYLNKKLKNVILLKGKIIQIKTINKGEFIGYNQTYKTSKKIEIAIIGVGYADGVPRFLSNKGKVYFKKSIFNIIGRISMDSFTIDISKSKYNLKEGDYVDLINKSFGIEKFADSCQTISNEVITSIGSRVKRIYV